MQTRTETKACGPHPGIILIHTQLREKTHPLASVPGKFSDLLLKGVDVDTQPLNRQPKNLRNWMPNLNQANLKAYKPIEPGTPIGGLEPGGLVVKGGVPIHPLQGPGTRSNPKPPIPNHQLRVTRPFADTSSGNQTYSQ